MDSCPLSINPGFMIGLEAESRTISAGVERLSDIYSATDAVARSLFAGLWRGRARDECHTGYSTGRLARGLCQSASMRCEWLSSRACGSRDRVIAVRRGVLGSSLSAGEPLGRAGILSGGTPFLHY